MDNKDKKSSQDTNNNIFSTLFSNNKATKTILAIAFALIGSGHLWVWHTGENDIFKLSIGLIFIIISLNYGYQAYSENKKT